jgi:DNA invertase Pin-like site-specific DNA recombinase
MNYQEKKFEEAGTIRCAIYKRSAEQSQNGDSLMGQESVCREFAWKRGWIVLDDYIREDRAMSGISIGGRKGLNSLFNDAKTEPRPFDYILFSETSRLSRDLADVLNLSSTLAHCGVHFRFVNQGLDSSDPNFRLMLISYGMVRGR